MWIAVILVAAVILSAFLVPKPNIENAKAAKFGDLNFPRSNHGDPIPLVWGTVRQNAPVTLWYGDYRALPITKSVSTGLFSSTDIVTAFANYVGIDLALCLGPEVVLKKFWAGKELIWEGSQSEPGVIFIDKKNVFGGKDSAGGLYGNIEFYDGRFNPEQSDYLKYEIGENVPAYNGIARCVFRGFAGREESFYIGTTTTPEAFAFEIARLTTGLHPTYSIMPNGLDVNPMEVAFDAFTQKWGKLGTSTSDLDLDSFISAAEVLYNEGIGMSFLLQAVVQGKDVLEEIARVADCIFYQDTQTGKIKVKLIRADYDTETLLVLDQSSISNLKNFQKTTWDNTFNQCRVSFKDRNNDYNKSVAVTQDFANINYQSQVRSTELNVQSCADSETASKLAVRQLSLVSVPLYKCNIEVNRKAQALRPGDVFILNWEPYSISNVIMRVSEIDLGTLNDNKISISCVQDRFATEAVIFDSSEITNWVLVNTLPNPVTVYKIFTPPYFLVSNSEDEVFSQFNTKSRFYLLASEPSSASVSFDVKISNDNFVFNSISSRENAVYFGAGTLADDYLNTVAKATRNDTVGFTVNNMSQTIIDNLKNYTTLNEARDGSALILINDELFVYVGFTDNGNGSVTFSNIYRGILDTAPETHLAGVRVWFLNSTNGLIDDLLDFSTNRQFKILDRTAKGVYDEALASSISSTLSNRTLLPLPPAFIEIEDEYDFSRNPDTILEMPAFNQVNFRWKNRSKTDKILRVYADSDSTSGPDTWTYVRVRFNGGAWNTEDVLPGINTSYVDLNNYGTYEMAPNKFICQGTFEVEISAWDGPNNVYSTEVDLITFDVDIDQFI